MASTVPDILQDLLDGHDVDLDSDDEGTLLREAEALSSGPDGAELFLRLAEREEAIAYRLALHVVASTWDPGAMAEIASALGHSEDAGPYRGFGQAFLERATDRQAHYGVRSHALRAATIIAQNDRPLYYRLCAVLLEIDESDDGQFARHAARVIGAILAHGGGKELHERLRVFLQIEAARDEAALELGCDCLRQGLEARAADEAARAFAEAKSWFEEAIEKSEDRPDAVLFLRCTDMLVSFQAGGLGALAKEKIDGIQAASFEWCAYLTSSDRPDGATWLSFLEVERIAWTGLSMRLGALDLSLGKRAWLHAAAVIEDELAAVFNASRRFFDKEEGGLDHLVRPRILESLRLERTYLAYLDQWLYEHPDPASSAEVALLRSEVRAAWEESVERRPSEAVSAGAAVTAITERFVAIAGQEEVKRILLNASVIAAENMSPIIEELLQTTVRDLQRNQSYSGETQSFFDSILLLTLRYAESRHALSVASVPAVAFLFNRDTVNPPLEKQLQQDFHGALALSLLASSFAAEARDLGGGRVDVLFSHKGRRISAEMKREFADRSDAELVDAYGPQSMAYQGTNVPLCILIVLDLVDRGGAQPPLREQVSVHYRTPKASRTEHAIVLFRIQGRRKTPSDQSG